MTNGDKRKPAPGYDETSGITKFELVQFSDGRTAHGYNKLGDQVVLQTEKFARSVHILGSPDLVLLKTASGKRYAMGGGAVVRLPELDPSTSRFGEVGEPVDAALLRDISPGELPVITIGEPLPLLIDSSDPIEYVLIECETTMPGDSEAAQAGIANPFDSAREHVERVVELMAPQ